MTATTSNGMVVDGFGDKTLLIFGYGSLMWYPGFEFDSSSKAMVRGYVRRFYQGNTTFRGTDELPGRVATLLESDDESAETFGLLFEVRGRSKVRLAVEHLFEREVLNGGYELGAVQVLDFESGATVLALTCLAATQHHLYLGPTSNLAQMAWQIANARGRNGPNSDYLLDLARCARTLFPEHADEHLFALERLVLALL